MKTREEAMQQAKIMMSGRFHTEDWSTHRCSYCGFEKKIFVNPNQSRCPCCWRFGTFEHIIDKEMVITLKD